MKNHYSIRRVILAAVFLTTCHLGNNLRAATPTPGAGAGHVFGWGLNDRQQIGVSNDNLAFSTSPVAAPTPPLPILISRPSVGAAHTVGISYNLQIASWG